MRGVCTSALVRVHGATTKQKGVMDAHKPVDGVEVCEGLSGAASCSGELVKRAAAASS